MIGGGSDTLLLKVSEDAYKGDAQFTVSVDGKQLGGTFTATTLHASGGSQSFAFKGDFGAGAHTVSVKFLNDAYAGTAATDRNLYVNDIVYNGTDTHLSAALMGNGAKTFSVSGGTTPSVSETGDHGSLQKNLSQTGTYTVGGDTFVLDQRQCCHSHARHWGQPGQVRGSELGHADCGSRAGHRDGRCRQQQVRRRRGEPGCHGRGRQGRVRLPRQRAACSRWRTSRWRRAIR